MKKSILSPLKTTVLLVSISGSFISASAEAHDEYAYWTQPSFYLYNYILEPEIRHGRHSHHGRHQHGRHHYKPRKHSYSRGHYSHGKKLIKRHRKHNRHNRHGDD